jgi:hypothetical protein
MMAGTLSLTAMQDDCPLCSPQLSPVRSEIEDYAIASETAAVGAPAVSNL